MNEWVARISLVAAASAVGGGLGALVSGEETPQVVLSGYEYPLPNPGGLPALLAHREAQLLSAEAHLDADDEVVHTTLGELGFAVDHETARAALLVELERARAARRFPSAGWFVARLTRQPIVARTELTLTLDERVARAHLERLAARVERDPIDARMLIDDHRIEPSRTGRKLSVEATLVRLRASEAVDELVIPALVDIVEPAVSEADLAPVDVTRVLADFETSFRGKAGPREVNIRTAARFLNGAVILPGETFSFNQQVGHRVHGRGFVDAPVIVNDELEDDVGGGVCQVATTLHAAAVYGNLDIVRRRSHSRPSGYAPIGLDATVIDGKVDLLIRNPYDEPLLVHATFPERYKLRVELLGREAEAKVEHASAVTHSEPFARRVWFKEELPEGAIDKKQKGSPGMDVVSVLNIVHEDGKRERRTYFSKYYPVPEVFHLGRSASPGLLPPLPEGATGLVVDGEAVEGSGPGGSTPTEDPRAARAGDEAGAGPTDGAPDAPRAGENAGAPPPSTRPTTPPAPGG